MGTTQIEQELDNLLLENPEFASTRAAGAFDKLVGDKKIILVGSGNLGRKILAQLQKHNIPVAAFTDNNQSKWHTVVNGIFVLPPAEAAADYKDQAVFIVCIWSPGHHFKDTKIQFQQLGCQQVITCIYLFWKFPEEMLPYYHFDLPQKFLLLKHAIKTAFNLLSDEESKKQYLAHIKARLFLDFENLPYPTGEKQYFPPDIFTYREDEVFLDGGAFNGDTLNSFLDIYQTKFNKYLALEPDPANFIALQENIAQLDDKVRVKVKSYEFALRERKEILYFEPTGMAGATLSNTGSLAVQCISVDQEFAAENPTFIKLDIEGAERFALKGAEKLIRSQQPLLAVCIYHMPDCLWSILLYLQDICPTYSFFCRTYEGDGLDFVLFAVPPSRLK